MKSMLQWNECKNDFFKLTLMKGDKAVEVCKKRPIIFCSNKVGTIIPKFLMSFKLKCGTAVSVLFMLIYVRKSRWIVWYMKSESAISCLFLLWLHVAPIMLVSVFSWLYRSFFLLKLRPFELLYRFLSANNFLILLKKSISHKYHLINQYNLFLHSFLGLSLYLFQKNNHFQMGSQLSNHSSSPNSRCSQASVNLFAIIHSI